MKLIVIGLDGAAFELLDPWIEEGILPNIKKIKENGVYGNLESCLPPVTSPNWKCYSTGKNPGKLGIYWWENIDIKEKRVYYPYQRKFKHKEIWDYLSKAGYTVGVIGTPLTYPPKKVNGFMISGGPDADNKDYTYPKDLMKKLKEKYGFKLRPNTPISIDKEKGYQEITEIIEKYFLVGKALWSEYDLDFLQMTIFEINILQHFFWNGEKTKNCWKLIDNYIGDFINMDVNVLLMSDHGSNRIENVFNINLWLENEGYLRTNIGASRILQKIGITASNLSKLARKTGLYRLKRSVPKKILNQIPNQEGQFERESKSDKIDWEKSTAIASGQGPVYINRHLVSEEGYDNLRDELIQKLQDVKSPSGGKIIKQVHKKEDIYIGNFLQEAPDLIVDQEKGVHIPGGIGKRGVFEFAEKWVAENKKFGLFALYGKGINKGKKFENVKILDLAPTILHMFRLSVPNDMDGRVLKEIFTRDSEIAKRPISYQKTKEVEKIKNIVAQLKKSNKI